MTQGNHLASLCFLLTCEMGIAMVPPHAVVGTVSSREGLFIFTITIQTSNLLPGVEVSVGAVVSRTRSPVYFLPKLL